MSHKPRPKPCTRCKELAAKLNASQGQLRDLARSFGDGTVAHLLQGHLAMADNAAAERDRWRNLALFLLARVDRLNGDIRLAWKALADEGNVELVFCGSCATRIEGTVYEVLTDEQLAEVDEIERRAG